MNKYFFISIILISLIITGCTSSENSNILSTKLWLSRAKDLNLSQFIPQLPLPIILPSSTSPTKENIDLSIKQLLIPDSSFLCFRTVIGSTADIRYHTYKNNSVLIARSDKGLLFSPSFNPENQGKILSKRLSITPSKSSPKFSPSLTIDELLLLRVIYMEKLKISKLLNKESNLDRGELSLTSIQKLLQTPFISSMILAQSPRNREKLSLITTERITMGLILENLRKKKLLGRKILDKQAYYYLSPDGEVFSELIFAPKNRLIITKYYTNNNGSMPLTSLNWASNDKYGIVYILNSDNSIKPVRVDLNNPQKIIEKMFEIIKVLSKFEAVG